MKPLQKPLLCLRSFTWAAIFVIATSSGVFAKDAALYYLATGEPDATVLLAPPPLLDSPEQAAEMQEVRAVYHDAPQADKDTAYSEKSFTVFNFTGAVGDYFTATNLPKTAAFFEKVQSDAATITDLGKDYFKRPRPFMTDPSLGVNNGKLEKSFSYPSGHSTESMVLALVLADLIPDKHDAIIAHARTIGWHRVEIARHYPSDIFAGRTLAKAIVRDMEQSDTFKKDFAEARAEIAAAQK
jgi:acid phosphatase (class A)